ncbi:HAD family phosphatase [Streptomyces sp. NBC_01275]|uniref:HAD family hydrolase n=1 Tax=Streptomyces sp. NBC_01275 TaxID=2903807 RepID=UPI002257F311|nr:HAD family phosphatase [Streptomyces sp. NBC_01275]MCX4760028.1 HAD family phosphatase [Streptomyces sp. NBC_01275]
MKSDLTAYDAAIMDWDGTVVDSQPMNFRCLAGVLKLYGVTLRESWYRERLGTSVDGLLAELGVSVPLGDVLPRCGELIIQELPSLQAFPMVVEWLVRARAGGLVCAVASGGGGAVVRAGIEATGLTHLFDVVVTREDAVRGKPAPDLFLEAARQLRVPPQRCLVVEDAEEGLAAARAAGMDVVDVRPYVTSSW